MRTLGRWALVAGGLAVMVMCPAAHAADEVRRLPVETYVSKMKAGRIGQMAGVGGGGKSKPVLKPGVNVLKLPDKIHAKTKFLTQEFIYYQPKGLKPSEKAPLLFFLHGIGGRGNDINPWADRLSQKPREWFKYLDQHGIVTIFPQCALGDQSKSIAGKKGDGWWQPVDLSLLLLYVAKTYNIDKNRIYLSGFSMGAFGTWSWAIETPRTFAAVVPVAGGGDPKRVGVLRNVPIWVFHGAKDTRVPPSRSQVMVDALRKAGSNKVKFTIDPDKGHSASGFNKPELYEWLVKQKKKS